MRTSQCAGAAGQGGARRGQDLALSGCPGKEAWSCLLHWGHLTRRARPWLEGCGLRTGKKTKSRPFFPKKWDSLPPLLRPVWGPSRKWEGWGPGAKHGCRPASCPPYALGRKVKGGDRPHKAQARPGPSASIC